MQFGKKYTFSFEKKSNPEFHHEGENKKTFSFGERYKKEEVLEKSIESLKNSLLGISIELIFHKHPELEQIGTREDYAEYLRTIFPDSISKDIVYHGVKSGENFDKFEYKPSVDPKIKDHNCFFFTTSYEDAKTGGTGNPDRSDSVLPVILNIKEDSTGFIEKRKIIINGTPKKSNGTSYDRGVRKGGKLLRDLKFIGGYPGNIQKKDVDMLKKEGVKSIVLHDSWFGNHDSKSRFVVFNPEDIHILGSKNDIQMFKEFVQKKKGKS